MLRIRNFFSNKKNKLTQIKFEHLPKDIILYIADFLAIPDLICFSQVNREINKFVKAMAIDIEVICKRMDNLALEKTIYNRLNYSVFNQLKKDSGSNAKAIMRIQNNAKLKKRAAHCVIICIMLIGLAASIVCNPFFWFEIASRPYSFAIGLIAAIPLAILGVMLADKAFGNISMAMNGYRNLNFAAQQALDNLRYFKDDPIEVKFERITLSNRKK